MKLPNTFILGGSKCGTSTLQKVLSHHSEMYFTDDETHYFSRSFYTTPVELWVNEYFIDGQDKKIIGDKSVTHSNSKTYLEAIKHYCGDDVKNIFMMRDPIDKFLSWWSFMNSVLRSKIDEDYSRYSPDYYSSIWDEMDENTTFESFLSFQLERYYFLDKHQPYRMSSMNKIQLGRYDILLDNIQSVFGDNCHYIITEEFKTNRSVELTKLFKYLEVGHEELPFMIKNSSDKSVLTDIDESQYEMLYDIYRPSVQKVKDTIGRVPESWRDYGIS
jgi:hypothetical protein